MGRSLTRWQEPVTLGLAALALLTILAPPLIATVLEAAAAPGGAWLAFATPRLFSLLTDSIVYALCTTIATLLFGVPLGVLLGRSHIRLAGLALFLHSLPLALPPFLTALAAFHLFGRSGWWGGETTASGLFGPVGLIAVLTLCFTPIATLLTWLGVRGTEPSGDEAARCVAGPWRTLARVVLPQAAPSITLGVIVVFALALAEFAVPAFLRVDVYSAAVFARLGGFAFAPGEAAALAAPLIAVSMLLWVLERRAHGERAIALPRNRPTPVPLLMTPKVSGCAAVSAIFAAVLGVAPLVILCVVALQGNGYALMTTYLGNAATNSVVLATFVSTLCIAPSVVFASAVRMRAWLVSLVDAVAWIGFLLPPAVLAIGAIVAWNRPSTQWIYASTGILVLALAARYLTLGLRISLAAERQVSSTPIEVARTLGASYFQRLAYIEVPLVSRSLLGAWLLVFVFCLRDTETTALVYPPGAEPLTVRIFTLEANGPTAVVAALTTLQAALTTLPLIAAALLFRRPQ